MNARIPTEKAHGYQITKMCEALAGAGAQVSLFVPTRKNETKGDIFSYYDVRKNFTIRYVPAPDALNFFNASRAGFYFQALSFLFAVRREAIPRDTMIVTRSPEIAWFYSRKGYRVFYDAHNYPEHGAWLFKWLLRGIAGVIANSGGTALAYTRNGFKRVLTAPNAVDLSQFAGTAVPERSTLGLPSGHIAMYVGHLYGWKGAEVVVDAARSAKDKNLHFVFVGGTANDVAQYREKTGDLSSVSFLGHRQRNEIPSYIKSADVLLLPNIPSTAESISYTSPIKMFEYMASGVPTVASDLPSIREILNDTNATLVVPGDPGALLAGIERALEPAAQKKAARARDQVAEYTWDARARNVIHFLKQ